MGLGPILGCIAVQWYIYVAVGVREAYMCPTPLIDPLAQTRMLVQTEAIITQLVFDHALRIRVKSETSSGTPGSSIASSVATTPDNASIADASERSESPGGDDDDETQTAVSEGTNASRTSKDKKSRSASEATSSTTATATEPTKSEGPHAGNLVGKLNNLVTSDLNNVTNGRDFLFVCELCSV